MTSSQNSRAAPKPARKEKVAHIRFSPAEFAAIEEAADHADTTISGFVRSLSLEGAGVRPCLTEADRAVFALLLEDMRAIGGNLNQMARALNGGRSIPAPEIAANIHDAWAIATVLANELKGLAKRSGTSRRSEAA